MRESSNECLGRGWFQRTSLSILLLFLLLVLVLPGCGGGTAGTSRPPLERSVVVTGNIRTELQIPIAGAEVGNSSREQSVLTDSEGRFQVEAFLAQQAEQVELLVTLPKNVFPELAEDARSQEVSVPVALGVEQVELSLQVQTRAEGVQVVALSVLPLSQPDGALLSATPAGVHDEIGDRASRQGSDRDPTGEGSQLQSMATSETGRVGSLFRGTVFLGDEPLSQVRISIPQLTKSVARTGTRGRWRLATKRLQREVTLSVDALSLDRRGTVQLSNLPLKPSLIELTLRFTEPAAERGRGRVDQVPIEVVEVRISRR
ncbi:hypothetical protein MRY87_13305 [bacterium]|nr:hypothetical protein [bacterium]